MTKCYNNRQEMIKSYLFLLVFPLVIFYNECILNLFTVTDLLNLSVLSTFFFSCMYGIIISLLITFIKNKKALHIVTSIALGVTSLPYLVQYFVYRQFKMFYDLNTMTGGAKDALGSFSGEMFDMIFSFEGIAVILLYALPIVLYAVFGKKFLVR